MNAPAWLRWIAAGWLLLQLPRLIAIPLIGDVLAGTESPAWLYPAILDCFVAIFAPVAAWLFMKRPDPGGWLAPVLLLVVSIIDHGGSISADVLTPTPRVFGGENGPQPVVVSGIQAFIDILVLTLLFRPTIRKAFGMPRH